MLLGCLLAAWLLAGPALAGCPMHPTAEQTSEERLPGDGGYRILLSGDHDKYIPNAVYTVSLQGTRDIIDADDPQEFTRFTLSVDSQHSPFNPAARVGYFQIFPDSLIEFNEDCVNTVSEASDYPKAEVQVMWRAPAAGSGCVIFTAMVLENSSRWYAEDGRLSKTFCEMSARETESLDALRCCACDDAKYKLAFEGIWSKTSHPKDFPEATWLTHFSDLVGASHATNFSFWGREHVASDGFRQLAEWGSASGLEAELRAKADQLSTYVRAPGLWYPYVNSNTSASFKVDRRHPLLSVASMVGPSPDWVVGVSKLNLCQRDCTWIKGMTIDLYPWDAGTDSGITYTSPNAETRPRERMKPITTMYPEDPRSPFYDPSGRPMLPLARLYLEREEITRRSCDEPAAVEPVNFDSGSVVASANKERPECLTTEFSDWTPCSVSCGRGLMMRTRAYRIPEQATAAGCNKQLVIRALCDGQSSDCPNDFDYEEAPSNMSSRDCQTIDWNDWSECSVSCGSGTKSRQRRLLFPENRSKCAHVSLVTKKKCKMPACEVKHHEDEDCKVTEWTDWSPCSASCGKGFKTRTRLFLIDDPEKRIECAKKVQLIKQQVCFEQTNCKFDLSTAKTICLEKTEVGTCRGLFQRWTFNPEKRDCESFLYSGCGANRNNFLSHEECTKTCDTVRMALSGVLQPTTKPLEASTEAPRHAFDDRLETSNSKNLTPVDCEVSDWTSWSKCSVSCGRGFIISTRHVTQQPENGGKPCPKRLQRQAQCQMPSCDN